MTSQLSYTWCCDKFGCLWQATSNDRDEAHNWAAGHTDEKQHPVSLYVEVDS